MANDVEQYKSLKAEVQLLILQHAETLRAKPHPGPSFARTGKTLLDYAQYILKFGRVKGMKRLKGEIEGVFR